MVLFQFGLAAASAGLAGAEWLTHAPSAWSLLLAWGVVSAVFARVTSLFSSVTAHQADLQRTMASMQVRP
jgi:hypothetical protein